LKLGRTPGELEAAITADELAEFAVLDELDPWGPERADHRAALIAAAAVAAAGGEFAPEKFLFYKLYGEALAEADDGPTRKQNGGATRRQRVARARAAFAALNARLKRPCPSSPSSP
jgi:hypothetical protein